MSLLDLDPNLATFAADADDRDVWARQVTESKRKRGKGTVTAVDLEAAITGIEITDTIRGASTVAINVVDPDWKLIDSGFFDAEKEGDLDAVDVNYPEGSRFWWRLMNIEIDGSRGGAEIVMTFIERAAAHLMHHYGPEKARRGKVTRAEFLKGVSRKVKAGGGIDFRSKQLHREQPMQGQKRVNAAKKDRKGRKREDEREADKDGGINPNERLTIKGAPASAAQLRQVERALDVAADENASGRATLALLVAGIGESDFKAVINSLGYGGVFQGQVNTGGRYFDVDDTEEMARCFLRGGKGFAEPGAIVRAARGESPGDIATRTEVSGKPGSFYGQHLGEAQKLLEAYGGTAGGGGSLGGGRTITRVKPYHFEIGTPQQPRESFWDGMMRLAEEVNWPLFLDGQRMYYDSEMTLIGQKPVGILSREDPALVSIRFSWDNRHIATEMELELICSPLEFRAGQVLKFDGFGPASSGSTADLPGRWLISEVQRDVFALSSRFTLKQPERPKKEPKPEIVKRQVGGSGVRGAPGGGGVSGSSHPDGIRGRIVEIAKATMSVNSGFERYSQPGALTDDPTPPAPARTDCSQWVRACYLKAGAGDPGTYTGDQISRGKRTRNPKPGDLMFPPGGGHVELLVDPASGRTIGHGNIKIDPANVSAWPGHFFITYDFLD